MSDPGFSYIKRKPLPGFRVPRSSDVDQISPEPQTATKVPRTPAANNSRDTDDDDWIQNSRSFLERHVSYTAPSTSIAETPARTPRTHVKPSSSKAASKGKSRAVDNLSPSSLYPKTKEVDDFQIEVDRVERLRDLADPDFPGPSTSTRKRSASDQDGQPSSAKKVKRRCNRKIAIEPSSIDDPGEDHDKHLLQVKENWGAVPDRWMPKFIMPSKNIKSGKDKGKRQQLDPKDWDGRLLAALATLSELTKNDPTSAYKALQDAVSRKDRFGGRPQILESDVHHARQILEKVASSPAVATPAAVLEGRHSTSSKDNMNQSTSIPRNEADMQSPTPRSPTFGADARVIKQETPSKAAPKGAAMTLGKEWDGYDDEMDKLEELKLIEQQKLAIVEAKAAQYAALVQKRRVRGLARMHGRNKDDAILLRPEYD